MKASNYEYLQEVCLETPHNLGTYNLGGGGGAYNLGDSVSQVCGENSPDESDQQGHPGPLPWCQNYHQAITAY